MKAWDKATYRYNLDTVTVDTDQRTGGICIIPVLCKVVSYVKSASKVVQNGAFFYCPALHKNMIPSRDSHKAE
jgi:hypothetical protein